jgi:hypothetical protein
MIVVVNQRLNPCAVLGSMNCEVATCNGEWASGGRRTSW